MANINTVPSTAMLVLLRTLENGPLSWTKTKEGYFGPARSKHSASTSFYMKLKDAIESKEFVSKDPMTKTYELTEKGSDALQAARDAGIVVEDLKTQAQIKWEQEHPEVEAVVETAEETEEVSEVEAE